MASFINTNVASLQAQNNLSNSQGGLSTSLERLSSGLRINSAADDAAGFAISQRMTAQINGLNQASQNANDGISLAQTAGGALTSVESNLQTLRTLAVESANATNTSSDRQALNAEAQQLVSAIQNTATTTQFNGENLLDGSFQAQQFQVGANADQTISVSVAGATTNTLGNYGGASTITSATYAGTAPGTAAWSTTSSIAINGVQIGASNATTAPGVAAGSAYANAAAINAQTSLTGVTATAYTTTDASLGATTTSATAPTTATAGSATASGNLWINGVAIGSISSASSELGQIQNSANAINAVAAQSGVTATADASTGTLVLTAQDGRNIQIATDSTADQTTVLNATGLAADAVTNLATSLITSGAQAGNLDTSGVAQGGATALATYNGSTGLFTGALTLNSATSINLTDSAGTGTAATNLIASGLENTAGTAVYSSQLASLASLSLDTITGANAAINIVDAAINQINAQQANLGAVQNNFTSTISNLNTASTNLSAAQSRIEDTDYAAETANLAHYQILQQAGTAMLAQANSLPNSVLTLLR
jgi:flagellin